MIHAAMQHAMRSPLQSAMDRIGSAVWTPATLFAASEQGVWYDPSDFSTMFQDSAGTTPVTAVGQPVGRILDKSGRGNHATQDTAAARPVLSARVNLITGSEDVTNAGWTKNGIQPFGSGSIANVSASGIATADFICETATTERHSVSQSFSQQANRVAFQCKLKAGGRNFATLTIYNGAENLNVAVNLTTGELSAITSEFGSFTGSTASAELLPSGFCLVKLSGRRNTLSGLQASISIGTGLVADFGGTSYAGDGVSGIYVAEAQFETGAAQTPYQRVNTATDYDTVGFPHYLDTDGVDDSMAQSGGGGSTTAFMLCAAVKPEGGAASARTIWSDSGTNTGYIVRLNASNQLEISVGNGTAYTTIATTATVDVGTAYVVTAWDDGTNLNVQVNNGTVASVARPTVSAGTATATLGKDNGAATGFFNGTLISVIQVTNDGGTADERTAAKAYAAGKGGVTL